MRHEPAHRLHVAGLVGLAVVAQPLLLALALSLAGNAALGWAWLHERDLAAVAVAALDGAQQDAQACTDAVNGLSQLATDRAAAAKTERAAAKQASGKLYKRADRTLSKPQGTGTCEGMQALGDDWLRERGQ